MKSRTWNSPIQPGMELHQLELEDQTSSFLVPDYICLGLSVADPPPALLLLEHSIPALSTHRSLEGSPAVRCTSCSWGSHITQQQAGGRESSCPPHRDRLSSHHSVIPLYLCYCPVEVDQGNHLHSFIAQHLISSSMTGTGVAGICYHTEVTGASVGDGTFPSGRAFPTMLKGPVSQEPQSCTDRDTLSVQA